MAKRFAYLSFGVQLVSLRPYTASTYICDACHER